MTEKDLDIAIEKCERIMEFDTRTLKDPESENGWIFEKVYDLLKFLRQLQFATDTNVATTDTISRQAALDALNMADDKGQIHSILDVNDVIKSLPSAQPGCEDAVSRKAAIDALPYLLDYEGFKGESGYVSKNLVRTMLKGLPSVTPKQPVWIPVTERLPKYGEVVLWCNQQGSVFTSAITWQRGNYGVGQHHGVTAWMSLPKPWEGDEK